MPALPVARVQSVTPAPDPSAPRTKVQGDTSIETRELLNALTRHLGETSGDILARGIQSEFDRLDAKTRREVEATTAALLTAARAKLAAVTAAPKGRRK